MRRLKKGLKITAIVLAAIAIVSAGIIYVSGPELPDGTEEVIDTVMASQLPELVAGETGYARSGGINIWYESISPDGSPKGTVLLFMGISNDALGWPQDFLDALAEAGYQVVRYDYRGTGMSDWMEDGEEDSYALADLADDATVILDSLNAGQAHLVGVSLGGMVAQEFAINNPNRVSTLTLIMSSGNIVDENLPPISQQVTFDLIKAGLKYGIIPTERNMVKLHVAARTILRGEADYDIDVAGTATQVLYNLRKRRGYNSDASRQHHAAVFHSGSRYEQLKKLEVPTLIIHGRKDPFIPIEHSQKLATVIPNAKTKWFDNMGHDVPPVLYDALVAELISNFERNPGNKKPL